MLCGRSQVISLAEPRALTLTLSIELVAVNTGPLSRLGQPSETWGWRLASSSKAAAEVPTCSLTVSSVASGLGRFAQTKDGPKSPVSPPLLGPHCGHSGPTS